LTGSEATQGSQMKRTRGNSVASSALKD
jgi:hypothetical protein